jgi:AGCS family alanine or glycine:cation symporter
MAVLSFAFYADANVTYMCKKMKNQANVRKVVMAVMILQTIIIFFASSRTALTAWNIADIGTGLMTWANLIALIFLSPKAIRVFNDYVRQRKLGLDPVFEPEDCGIENADLWDEIVDEKYADLRDAKWKAEGKTSRNMTEA